MKKTINKEVILCDSCDKEAYVDTCLRCGAQHCYDCRKIKGVRYIHSVYFSGSNDGYYCNECDSILYSIGDNKLHSAYVKIKNLRKESELFYDDFKKRTDEAEITLKQIGEK